MAPQEMGIRVTLRPNYCLRLPGAAPGNDTLGLRLYNDQLQNQPTRERHDGQAFDIDIMQHIVLLPGNNTVGDAATAITKLSA